MIVDAGQHVGEPGVGIDAVELGGLKQGVHERRPARRPFGTGEEPSFPAEGNPAECSFRRVVGQADAAVVEEASEGQPALEHIVDGLGGIGMAGEPGALGAQPGFEFRHQRRDMLFAVRQAVPADCPLITRSMGEDGVDPLHGFEAIGETITGLLLRALAAISARTKNFLRPCAQQAASDDRRRFAPRLVQPVEAGIGIGLQGSRRNGQVPLGMFARPVAREEVHRRRRIGAAERRIVTDISPQPAPSRSCPWREGNRRVVAMDALAGEDMGADQSRQRRQNGGAGSPTSSARVDSDRSMPSRA